MKQTILTLFTALCILCTTLPVAAAVPDPATEIQAEAAVLMEASTGQILYEKQADARMYPASITKILTAMLALENLNPADTLTASETAVDLPPWGSSIYLTAGERLSVEETLYGMMLRSANEAANVLAEEAAGSLAAFADLMNRRARELGATGTHFTNAHGLPDRNHYTTAADMALITRQALRTPGFLHYFSADYHTIPATNRSGARAISNTHKMLLGNSWQVDGEILGGKTGYTTQSGYTLVTVARQGERTLICVVMNSAGCYNDTAALLNFGFREFSPVTWEFGGPAEFIVPVAGDGVHETGAATLYRPDSASFLLHSSVAWSDLLEDYRIPAFYESQDAVAAEAVVILPDGNIDGLPETVLALPMEAETVLYEPVSGIITGVVVEERPATAQTLSASVVIMALSAILCCMLTCGSRADRRRRRTRRRIRNSRRHSRI